MNETLLVLGASLYQLDAIQTAKRLGYRVVTTDRIPANPGHRLADRSYSVDTTHRSAVLEIARAEHVSGVISPCTDVAVPTAAHVAERLGLRGAPETAAEIVCDKLRFREFLTLNGLPCPEAHRFTAVQWLDDTLFDGGRWIIKPDRSSGSKGIFIVRSSREFRQRMPESLEFSPTGTGILERYIDGVQGTCEGIIRGGRIAVAWILDRQTVSPPYVATSGHRLPSRHSAVVQSHLIILLERIWELLGVTEGPFDCDFVAASEEVYILEMSPRIGGNSISNLLRIASSFDLVEYAIQHACGKEPSVPVQISVRPTAVVLLGVQTAGRLSYDAAQANWLRCQSWVDSLLWDVELGSPVNPFINGRHRVGQAFVIGHNRDELDSRVAELCMRLNVRTI